MRWITEVMGELLDAFLGHSTTQMLTGETRNTSLKLRPTISDPALDLGVESRQVIYETIYHRWWGFRVRRFVYEVVGYAPDEIKDRFDPRLFQKATYPMLCLPWLKWTEYPHVYAIRAFLDRIPTTQDQRIKVNL